MLKNASLSRSHAYVPQILSSTQTCFLWCTGSPEDLPGNATERSGWLSALVWHRTLNVVPDL